MGILQSLRSWNNRLESVELWGIPQKKRNRRADRVRDAAAKGGFQVGQTAKARRGPPCAVTPAEIRTWPPTLFPWSIEATRPTRNRWKCVLTGVRSLIKLCLTRTDPLRLFVLQGCCSQGLPDRRKPDRRNQTRKLRPTKDRLMIGNPDDTTPESKRYTADEIFPAGVDNAGGDQHGIVCPWGCLFSRFPRRTGLAQPGFLSATTRGNIWRRDYCPPANYGQVRAK